VGDGAFRGEAARSVPAKVRNDVFARCHAVASKRCRNRDSQFGLLVPVLRATTTVVQMAAPLRNILDITSTLCAQPKERRVAPSHDVTGNPLCDVLCMDTRYSSFGT
jgi:hypothetical protein